ncbi:Metallo-dependent hydrolase [Aspergillus steynii IBT 23096]|uniref:Metallo-dependent hydrolase n=1 Tax=Aspergillus steynii IBT 23096 TaxID=1392250 RepID=A0A2I2GPW2_9EURO|nr:Metallo-dependent hydrolase [Aspergillus steynii IBT 23096]PLB54914.1 Metallo-dependent hydrolase [Aspergillus steynii IBT 23096]
MTTSILLKQGTLLIHDHDVIRAEQKDLLVEDSIICQIDDSINQPQSATVIDCSGKIISPGFIDTHHHVWQSCLKGTHADQTLVDYFWDGNFISSFLSPQDVFWSQLAGALECVDSGTTTVVDHAHINYSPEHSTEALRATIASGLRSVFAYCPTPRVASWKPEFTLDRDFLPPWVMETFKKLAGLNPFGPNGRVSLGFAFDGLFLPGSMLKDMYSKVREAGAQLITSHSVYGAQFGAPNQTSAAATLDDNGLLGPDILLSHNNNPTPQDARLVTDKKVKISSTPGTELQMGHGNPVCLRDDLYAQASLGIDCHSVCSAYMPAQMMLALQWARARRHEDLESQDKWSSDVGFSASSVFNLGTIHGARAIGMEDTVGSLAVGKKADLVVFDCTTPGMIVAADRDPVAAIVLHSTVRDVNTVIIDGVIRKKDGTLQPVLAPESISEKVDQGQKIEWKDIVPYVMELSRRADEKKKTTVDGKSAKKAIMEAFHMNVEGHVGDI